MTTTCECSTIDQHQVFPKSDSLFQNLNRPLTEFVAKFAGKSDTIYFYVVATVKIEQGAFVQEGSGPNFQGGLITLCTCKRFMRSFMSSEDWRGCWIAGFSGVRAGNGKNALLYLMQVGDAYDSFQALWKALPEKTRQAKSATLHRLGDMYQPIDGASDVYSYQSYQAPCSNHTHWANDEWHKDIGYWSNRMKRHSALLVGDPQHSFLWDRPKIFFKPDSIGVGQRKSALGKFLSRLLVEKT